MNVFETKTKDVCEYFIPLTKMYPKSYNKNTANPYTKTRVILMNGTEFESVWFMHQFARHTDNAEIKRALALVRDQEQQQQKRIACLKPLNESILETTIGYEQLAIDLTAVLAQNETDENNIKALNFALLEDFDHLYRFSNLMMLDVKNADPQKLVGSFTEIMPGRPTVAEHRFPKDNVKKCMNADKSKLFTKLVANIITGAEQQTMNYYMNISQWYKNHLGRQLYAEIAMIEEEHVTQYESLKDPTCTWLAQWVMHEFTECYLYYSAYSTEKDKYIKSIWQEHYEMEVAHLKLAVEMLEKFEKRGYTSIIGDGELPKPLELGTNKEYIRDVLARTVDLTSDRENYVEVMKLKPNADFFFYQDKVVGSGKEVPSHLVIEQAIKEFGKDYRYADSTHPVRELTNRKKDNINIGRL